MKLIFNCFCLLLLIYSKNAAAYYCPECFISKTKNLLDNLPKVLFDEDKYEDIIDELEDIQSDVENDISKIEREEDSQEKNVKKELKESLIFVTSAKEFVKALKGSSISIKSFNNINSEVGGSLIQIYPFENCCCSVFKFSLGEFQAIMITKSNSDLPFIKYRIKSANAKHTSEKSGSYGYFQKDDMYCIYSNSEEFPKYGTTKITFRQITCHENQPELPKMD